jgi:precorrin-6B methylase 1
MTTKRESITRRLVDMLVKLSPEEVAEMLLETDPTWFELLVRERLNGKVEETTKQLMAKAMEKAGRRKDRPG